VLEAPAWQTSLQLCASAHAFATHHEISEPPDASVARGPIVLLVFVASAAAYRSVLRCLDLW
jgi:hypothetical protein